MTNPQQKEITENGCSPQVVVMAPTRELCIQIYDCARGFVRGTVLKCCAVYGGTEVRSNVTRLKSGVEIVVATPGRLAGFLERGTITFSSIRFMVLDEADRMLDEGFLSAMKAILDHSTMTPVESRHTMLFSATFTDEIQALASQFMRPSYLFIVVGIVGGVCVDVEQVFYEVPFKEKRGKLFELLESEHADGCESGAKTIVFVEKKKTADFIAGYCSEKNLPSTSIHGDREQREREAAINDFRSGKRPILVATSVAARGLDIKGVTHVINYDLPKEVSEYVHRIGRTGRVGNKGKATSFYDPRDNENLRGPLCSLLKQANIPIPECLGDGSSDGGFDAGGDFGGHDIRNVSFNYQLYFNYLICVF